MKADRFYPLFNLVFRYPKSTELPLTQLRRLRTQVQGHHWSSARLLREFNSFYGNLSDGERQPIKGVMNPLIDLKKKETAQRKEIPSKFEQAIDDNEEALNTVSFTDFRTRQQFVEEWLVQANSEERKRIGDELRKGLDQIERRIHDSSYDLSNLEGAYEYGSEGDVVQELKRLYQHMNQKGWRRSSLVDLPSAAQFRSDSFKYLLQQSRKEVEEYTFVFFVPDFDPEGRINGEGAIQTIIPEGETSAGKLSQLYPYGSGDFGYIQPDFEEKTSGKAAIMIQVEAYSTFGASEIASENLSSLLDACSYLNSLADAENPQYKGDLHYITWVDGGEKDISLSTNRDPKPSLRFRDREREELAKNILPLLEADTELAERYRRGLHLYRKGNTSSRDIDTLVNYIACLETIATSDNASRGEKVDNMISVGRLWNTDEVRDQLESMLDARNDTLHAGLKRPNLEAEATTMRHGLGAALSGLAECIRESNATTVPGFVDYMKEKEAKRSQKHVSALREADLNTDTEYDFTGEIVVPQEDDGDVVFTFSGTVRFEYTEEHFIPHVKILTADQSHDERLPALHNAEMYIEAQETTLELVFHRIPASVSFAVTTNSFSHISPWKTIPRQVSVVD